MLYTALALCVIALALAHITDKLRRLHMDVQTILDKVNAEKTVIDSAVALLASLSQAIKDAGTDPAKLQAISDAIDAQQSELADAVAANTPAATTA